MVSLLLKMRYNHKPYYPVWRWQNRACCPDDVPPSERTDAIVAQPRVIVELLVRVLSVRQGAKARWG